MDVLLFVADKRAALHEIARILKPGSGFVGTSWELRAESAALHAQAFDDYPGAFKDAGFEIEILRIEGSSTPTSRQQPPMSENPISPLRQRMLEDMSMRRFVPDTQREYIRAVKRLATFLGRSPDSAAAEELRAFQLHLTETGVQPPTINATGRRRRAVSCSSTSRASCHACSRPKRYCAYWRPHPGPSTRPALGVAYSAGLRAMEVVTLKVCDMDSRRMMLRVDRGKGRKDRHAMRSPQLLELLRDWWRIAQPKVWMFPGRDRINPMTTRQLNRACHMAAELVRLPNWVAPHTLRHSFATQLLEQNVDIRVIQVMLGHPQLDTTALYTRVATKTIREVMSPLERIARKVERAEPPA